MWRKKVVAIFLCITCILSACVVLAHGGGTDSAGGHWDHETNEYHYHHGYPAHSHAYGCPYDYVDNTDYTGYYNPSEPTRKYTETYEQMLYYQGLYKSTYSELREAQQQIEETEQELENTEKRLKSRNRWIIAFFAIVVIGFIVATIQRSKAQKRLYEELEQAKQRLQIMSSAQSDCEKMEFIESEFNLASHDEYVNPDEENLHTIHTLAKNFGEYGTRAFIDGYDENIPVSEYAKGFTAIYGAAKAGSTYENAIAQSEYSNRLSTEARRMAYFAGQID